MRRDASLRVGIAGLGVIGLEVAKALDAGIPGLKLAAVAVRNTQKAEKILSEFKSRPKFCSLEELSANADIIVECAPSAVYDRIAWPAINAGLILITMSSVALLTRPDIFKKADETGARIIVPSGGMLGLDAIRAAREGKIFSVKLITRKPPASLAGAPHLIDHNIDVLNIREPLQIFNGNAREAAKAFPENANVAATLSLAGIGPEKTMVEIWADPGISLLTQALEVRSDSAELNITIQSYPMPDNPRTGSLTPKSAISALRSLVSGVRFGS